MQKAQEMQFSADKISEIITNHLPLYKKDQLSIKMMQGLTNYTYKVQSKDNLEPLVFRKFMGDFDRELQNRIYDELQKRGVAPKCYFANQDYRIQRFVCQGRHPTNSELEQIQKIEPIMSKIYDFHQTQIPQTKRVSEKQSQQPILIQSILCNQNIQKLSLMKHPNPAKQQQFAKLKDELLSILKNQQEKVYPLFPKDKSRIKFCHNDLNNLNIFITGNDAMLIDFQYASYNYVAFDVANFLNESCIDYSVKEYPLFKLIKKLNRKQIYQRAGLYKGKYQGFEEDVVKCLAMCNLYWANWSASVSIQDSHTTFGAIEHGLLRLQLFQYYYCLAYKENRNNVYIN